MDILSTILITTAINLVIIFLAINHLAKLLLDICKTQDKFNDLTTEHMCYIYDIIKFNGLTRPAKKIEREEK